MSNVTTDLKPLCSVALQACTFANSHNR